MSAPTTILDLSRLSLTYGEGKRLQLPVRLDPFELGGQAYRAVPDTPTARLEVSRPSGGFAFRLNFDVHLEGPCVLAHPPEQVLLLLGAQVVDGEDADH